jgi:O-antigen/teichoic acid export membrane protein
MEGRSAVVADNVSERRRPDVKQKHLGGQHMKTGQLKRAELASAIGAGVLGAGIVLLFPEVLATYAVAILTVGLLVHAWGMYDKHRIERQTTTARVWWAELLYWLCWLAIVGLAIYVFAKR